MTRGDGSYVLGLITCAGMCMNQKSRHDVSSVISGSIALEDDHSGVLWSGAEIDTEIGSIARGETQ